MENQINIASHPYGLGGGTILSGSVNISSQAFWYYPVTAATAIVGFSNLALNGGAALTGSISASFAAGVGVYGHITTVSQSSGIAILYSGSADVPRYTFD
jgi:hypothetical protein